ncbi:tryptophan synthase beta subunit-like PLP-dependent enzyme [Lindgomyces ingoldianus]|uniref:Tryptophan synthase beta subunit-like PLP-dependent enzyme n=1 Tax=Lindgomyces ingoldianus TaxID=673940 RepID=A0ACB6R6S9_9PLEO|nr:tryptophan synthase beta subunit-like PLP-dependent enzyme [Lindgomyces ingoldianus]KAF2474886.1 tryptophan synthase beta subunit-like PLP-dependent enzyme [Lindgomyces ingoldianus]
MTVKETLISSQAQKKPWIETPLKESYALSQAAGCKVFLKLENLQPSGSFKSRGIGNYILCRLEELPDRSAQPHIFSSSGGNAGLAAVHASRTLGLPCTVVVPLSTKPLMISKLKAAGAYEVIQHGPTWKDADSYLRKEVMAKAGSSAIYAPPFDHPDIWTGNSTLIDEIASQLPGPSAQPDVVICSVGGGGLFNGVCQGLDDLGMSSTTVLALETDGAQSLNKSLEAGQLITLPGITSQATSLGATRVTQRTLDYALRENVRSVVLPDAEAAMGCWRLADDERIMVEMASGINVALCYDGRLERVLGRKVKPEEKVVIVLCGGSNVTVDMLRVWREEFALVEESLRNGIGEVPSRVTAPNGNH